MTAVPCLRCLALAAQHWLPEDELDRIMEKVRKSLTPARAWPHACVRGGGA